MTTIIISTAHVCVWILVILCIIVIIWKTKKSAPEKNQAIEILAEMMIISIVLVGRDWDNDTSIIIYGIDGLIAATGSLIIYSKNYRTIRIIGLLMCVAISLVLLWSLIGNLIGNFGH